MDVSVVICTCDRPDGLRRTLRALRHQTHPSLEVIVVDAPSGDSGAVLKEFGGDVRVVQCPEPNVAMARNVGVAQAAGEIVAFIDDDAVPDPRWLAELAAGYDRDWVAGVGGAVYDHTGLRAQFPLSVADRRGRAHFGVSPPPWAYLIPQGDTFVHFMGTNASFRRARLVDVGGFDEELEYHLETTDICMRLVDRGQWLRFSDAAAVYHDSLPGRWGKGRGVLRNPFPVVKNKFYFALRSTAAGDSVRGVLHDCERFADELLGDARAHHAAGRLTAGELAEFESELERGVRQGIERGSRAPRRSAALPPAPEGERRPFVTVRTEAPLVVCFVTGDAPPAGRSSGNDGAAARATLYTAQAFARSGHEVHLIAGTRDDSRVGFEDGVWVHRLGPDVREAVGPAALPPPLRDRLDYAAAAHREVQRLARTRPVDLVVAPLRDGAGLFCARDDSLKCVLTLPTPLGADGDAVGGPAPGMDTAAHAAGNGNGAASPQASPDENGLLTLEHYTARAARHVAAPTRTALDAAFDRYGLSEGEVEGYVVPFGVPDRASDHRPRPADGRLRVLFVGDPEAAGGSNGPASGNGSGGIDALFGAAAVLAREFPHVQFVFLDVLRGGAAGDPEAAVVINGAVSERDRYRCYAACDVVCLPAARPRGSLLAALVDGLMFGKPLVAPAGCGAEAVVEPGVNGQIVDARDPNALVECLRRLVSEDAARREMGAASRRRYEAHFSGEAMAAEAVRTYTRIAARDEAGGGPP